MQIRAGHRTDTGDAQFRMLPGGGEAHSLQSSMTSDKFSSLCVRAVNYPGTTRSRSKDYRLFRIAFKHILDRQFMGPQECLDL